MKMGKKMNNKKDNFKITTTLRRQLNVFVMRGWWHRFKEKSMFWFVWKLPKNLVYFCAIRVVAYATTGKYSNTIVPELTAMDAVKRWEDV